MIFFNDFIKNVEKRDLPLEGRYIFRLETIKLIGWLGIAFPLILSGAYHIFLGYKEGIKAGYMLLGILVFLMGLNYFRNALKYKIYLDFEKGILKNDKLEITFDNVKSCTMKRMVLPKGKKLQICFDIITEDKKNIIIPMLMRRKVDFASLMRKKLADRFQSIKE